MFMNISTKLNVYFKLNIKHLSLSQNEFTSSKNMQNSLKMFDDVFKIINIQKLKFATSTKSSEKTLESVMSKSNIYINIFI